MKITSSNRNINKDIDIVVVFDPIVSNVAASDQHVEYRPNLPAEHQYSDAQLQWYNDLIENVLNLIEDYAGFNIIENYQSSESYSYYIRFEAFTSEGESLGDFNIKFRISDHIEPSKKSNDRETGLTRKQVAKKKLTIFRSILINNKSQKGMFDAIRTLQHICDELLDGNIDVLDELIQ